MAIEKNCIKVARSDPELFSPNGRDMCMSSDDNEDFQRRNSISAVESEDDDEFDDCDSGAGSDDFDLLELGESGEEFCQIGDQTCSIPYELYDLQGLNDVLSMDVWNEVLTEEERFELSKYLPDMDQENFVRTLKELFAGDNLHFGNPVGELFKMLKGGLCEPRVALYKQGLTYFQRTQHYHNLRKHQNAMVTNLCQIRDAWVNCKGGYSIEEKLRVLNIMKSQKSLMNENMEVNGSDLSERDEVNGGLWSKKTKDRKAGQKTGRYSGYDTGMASDMSYYGKKTTVETAKHGKHKPKGTLKLGGLKISSAKDSMEPWHTTSPGVELMSRRFGSVVSRYNEGLGHDSGAAGRTNKQILGDDYDEAETIYKVAVHRDRNFPQIDKIGALKRKKHEGPRGEDYVDNFMSMKNNIHAFGRNKNIDRFSDIEMSNTKPSSARNVYEEGKILKYPENLQKYAPENHLKVGKGKKSNPSLKGSRTELLEGKDPAYLSNHKGLFPTYSSYTPTDLNSKSKKWMGREAVGYEANTLESKFQSSAYGRRDTLGKRGISSFSRGDDTESDSSEQVDGVEDDNPLMRSKWAYPSGVPDLKHDSRKKKVERSKRDKSDGYLSIDGSSHSYSGNVEVMKSEHKGKMYDVGSMNILATKDFAKSYFPGATDSLVANEGQSFFPLGSNGQVGGSHGGRKRKGEVLVDVGYPQPSYIPDNNFQDDLFWTRTLASENGIPSKKDQIIDLPAGYFPEKQDMSLMGCNTLSKKRKTKDCSVYMDLQDNNGYVLSDAKLQLDDLGSSRKRGKSKTEVASAVQDNGDSEPALMEVELRNIEEEVKPQKKSFPLITPTIHTGFSFSIIHLLSAIRTAMITMLPEDSSEAGKQLNKNDADQGISKEEPDTKKDNPNTDNSSSNIDAVSSVPSAPVNVPSLTLQEIVTRVKSNPGDPSILETQEPLQDLVRGVLKIFSSRTAPLGAKGWKPLVVYEKSTKSWSWMGPVSQNPDPEVVEAVTSPDAWVLPHKMLVKLVDSVANWLKNSQDTLKQIGSLPPPPLELMQTNLDEKERFKDLRAQKSLSTISPCSEEVRAYFRKEEVLRYLIPDRAFSYTAVDGKKSIVAPLRRCGGKPTSKARDHFMLKRDRPPHVTILCLVRDAAARLPGSIGTRADVCTLIRDSQYIVEDVSEAQVNQVVSGALDRLHYERDPCVQFDGERKLWVYLHREREEEDFEDDGTSSTKKWRRQKKDVPETSEAGDDTIADPTPVEQSGLDIVSDLNVGACVADNNKRSEHDDDINGNDHIEENAEISHGSDHDTRVIRAPLVWNGVAMESAEENKLLCQENSASDDFHEDPFSVEPNL